METKELIVRKALAGFLVHGYEKTSLNSIANELGITKGAVYHYFKNKDELFRTSLEAVFGELESWLYVNLVNAPDFKTLLQNYCDFPAFFGKTKYIPQNVNAHFYKVIFDAVDRFDDMKSLIAESYKSYIELVKGKYIEAQSKGEVRSDLNAEIFSLQVTAMVEGLILFNALAPDTKVTEQTAEIFDTIWTMIKI